MTWHRVEDNGRIYSHERTLIARLGFADPDRRLPEHDLAARYLAEPAQALALAEFVAAPRRKPVVERPGQTSSGVLSVSVRTPGPGRVLRADGERAATAFRETRTLTPVTVERTILEWPIHKGDAQYRTTIGFVDVVIPYAFTVHTTGVYLRHGYYRGSSYGARQPGEPIPASWQPLTPTSITHRRTIYVEVKITPPSLGEVLRQIKLYQGHVPGAAADRD